MAIALNGAAISASAGSGSLNMPEWTPAANDLCIFMAGWRDATPVSSSVSGNGLTWVRSLSVMNTQSQNGFQVWYATGLAPTTGCINYDITGNALPVVCIAQRFSGVNVGAASAGIERTASSIGPAVDNNDMLGNITTITDSAWAVAGGTHRSRNFTAPSGETGILVNAVGGTGGNQTKVSMWYQNPGAISPPATCQLGGLADLSGSDDWCMAILDLMPTASLLVARVPHKRILDFPHYRM